MLLYVFAVLFYTFNTVVIFFAALYDIVVIIERYKRFLNYVVVSRRINIDNHSNLYVNYTQLIYVYVNRTYNL